MEQHQRLALAAFEINVMRSIRQVDLLSDEPAAFALGFDENPMAAKTKPIIVITTNGAIGAIYSLIAIGLMIACTPLVLCVGPSVT